MGTDKSNLPKISVIIPTRNRAVLLANCLYSLANQSVVRKIYEVIVVDNGSTDNTKAVVEKFYNRLNLQYFFAEEPGLHVGRHVGLRHSRSEILSYIDDDVMVYRVWVESLIDTFTDEGIVLAGGNNIPIFVKPPPTWLKKMWETPKHNKEQMVSPLSVLKKREDYKHSYSPYYVWGCNFSIRKSTLVDAGGFHPDGLPKKMIKFRGDGETHVSRYVQESGKKCVFHPGASVYHMVTPERMTVSYFNKRGFNQGISDSFTALRAEYLYGCSSKDTYEKLYRFGLWAYRKFKYFCIRDSEIRQVMSKLLEGYAEGYSYHQKAFQKDQEVRDWVLKESFYD